MSVKIHEKNPEQFALTGWYEDTKHAPRSSAVIRDTYKLYISIHAQPWEVTFMMQSNHVRNSTREIQYVANTS